MTAPSYGVAVQKQAALSRSQPGPASAIQWARVPSLIRKKDAVNVTNKGDGSYTFTMHDSKVGGDRGIVPEQQRHLFGVCSR